MVRNHKREELIYFRSVRPSIERKFWLAKCKDGICGEGTYFTISLVEAIDAWCKEETYGYDFRSIIVMFSPSPSCTIYYPKFSDPNDNKKYRNTRVIKDEKYLHPGNIIGYIDYWYRIGADTESFSIRIEKDNEFDIKAEVEATFRDTDLFNVRKILGGEISYSVLNSKLFKDVEIKIKKRRGRPKLVPCKPIY